MSKESKGRKPGALSRCLRFAGRRKPLVFASMALAVLSAAASFVPYVAIYFMIRDAVGVYPNLAAVDVSAMTGYAGLAVAGIVVDVGCYLAALLALTPRRSTRSTARSSISPPISGGSLLGT